MTAPAAGRRHIDLSALEEHVSLLKPKAGVLHDDSRKKTVAIPKDNLVPVIQADVGSSVPWDVYRYRLLLPIAQIVNGVRVALDGIEVDIDTLEETFTPPLRRGDLPDATALSPSRCRHPGSRQCASDLGKEQHAVYEVYAATIHASDEYFRAIRQELQEASRKA